MIKQLIYISKALAEINQFEELKHKQYSNSLFPSIITPQYHHLLRHTITSFISSCTQLMNLMYSLFYLFWSMYIAFFMHKKNYIGIIKKII
jgi:hypothetical protein